MCETGCNIIHVIAGCACTRVIMVLPRINLGGVNVVAYLNRLLQLSHPPLLPHLTLTRAQEMVHSHCYLAIEYSTELQNWASGKRLALQLFILCHFSLPPTIFTSLYSLSASSSYPPLLSLPPSLPPLLSPLSQVEGPMISGWPSCPIPRPWPLPSW